MKRGADSLDEQGIDTAHDTTTRFAWHSGGIFYGLLKAMVGTVMYFLTVLSLLYYFAMQMGNCPKSPIDAITSLEAEGWGVWVLVTCCYVPVMICELLMSYSHFLLYQQYQARKQKLEIAVQRRKKTLNFMRSALGDKAKAGMVDRGAVNEAVI